MTALPWLKWRPMAWRGDKPLQTCSLAARGLWHELCMIAHDCEPYGYVRIAGTVPDLAALAKLVGASPAETKRLLAELERIKVFSRAPDGAIYSRRMVKDEAARLKAAADGRLGGNPSLRGDHNGGDKGDSAHEDNGAPVRAGSRESESSRVREVKTQDSVPSERADAPTAPRVPRKPRAKKPSTARPGVVPFREFWCEQFEEITGSKYAFEHGKDGAHVNAILGFADDDLELAKDRALSLLHSSDPYFAEKGINLGTLRSQWNRIGSAGRTTSRPSEPKSYAAMRRVFAADGAREAEQVNGLPQLPGLGGAA